MFRLAKRQKKRQLNCLFLFWNPDRPHTILFRKTFVSVVVFSTFAEMFRPQDEIRGETRCDCLFVCVKALTSQARQLRTSNGIGDWERKKIQICFSSSPADVVAVRVGIGKNVTSSSSSILSFCPYSTHPSYIKTIKGNIWIDIFHKSQLSTTTRWFPLCEFLFPFLPVLDLVMNCS